MSSSSSGSFSWMMTAAVVCFENTETHPCDTPERWTIDSTWAVTSMNWRADCVWISRVSAQKVRPPARRTLGSGARSGPSTTRKTRLVAPIQLTSFGQGARAPIRRANAHCRKPMLRRECYGCPFGPGSHVPSPLGCRLASSLRLWGRAGWGPFTFGWFVPCRSSRCSRRAGPWSA